MFFFWGWKAGEFILRKSMIVSFNWTQNKTFKCFSLFFFFTFTDNLSVAFNYLCSIYNTWCVCDELIWLKNWTFAHFKGTQHLSQHSLLCDSASNIPPLQPLTTNNFFSLFFLTTVVLMRLCPSSSTSWLPIYVAASLRDLGIRPILTAACVLTENQAIRVKRQFLSNPENKRGSKEAVICRAGGQGPLLLWLGSWTARTAARSTCRLLGCTVWLLPLRRHAADGCRWKRPGPVWTKATEVTCSQKLTVFVWTRAEARFIPI